VSAYFCHLGRVIATLLPLLVPPAGAAELKLWDGGPAPALALKDLGGRDHRLADYKGRVVLVNFWATWCAPCRDEMPSIQRLGDKLAGRPFVVLAVNLDEPESRIRKFLSEVKLDFPVLLDAGRRVARAWNARILPASYIVGPDGRVRYTVVGEIHWDHEHIVSRITELLPAGRK
jgi:thiol-disulfide isomerase/thioredoxin